MKIGLGTSIEKNSQTSPVAQTRALEKDLAAAKRGDWEAKHRVERTVMPLLTSLAMKRSNDKGTINQLLERGKEGVSVAVRKFKTGTRGDRFQIFALPFIEKCMDKPARRSIFARLFRR